VGTPVDDAVAPACRSRLPSQWGAKRLRLAVDAAGVALWSWNIATDRFEMDDRGFELWGITASDPVTFARLSAHIRPADRDRVRADFECTRAIAGP